MLANTRSLLWVEDSVVTEASSWDMLTLKGIWAISEGVIVTMSPVKREIDDRVGQRQTYRRTNILLYVGCW